MDDAIMQLELQVKRVVNDLEFTSHALENDFRSSKSSSMDVVALIRRIGALETTLLVTKKRSDDLLVSRQRVTSSAAAIMLSNHARLVRLLDDKENHADNDAAENGDFNEARDELVGVLRECAFGVDASKYAPAPPPTSTTPMPTDTAPSSSSGGGGVGTTDAPAKDTVVSPPVPPSAMASTVAPFDEVSAAQFEAVPLSTRGRCKLADVQAVLTRLVAHYTASAAAAAAKKGGSKRASTSGGATLAAMQAVPPLSLQELGASGLKVAGKTGDCVVGALRALGLVKAVKQAAVPAALGGGGFHDGGGAGGGHGHGLATCLYLSDAALQSLYHRLK